MVSKRRAPIDSDAEENSEQSQTSKRLRTADNSDDFGHEECAEFAGLDNSAEGPKNELSNEANIAQDVDRVGEVPFDGKEDIHTATPAM